MGAYLSKCTGVRRLLWPGATANLEPGKPHADAGSDKPHKPADSSDGDVGVPVKTWVAGPDGRLGFPELDDPEFRIPALDDKAPLAICISGGGFRATTLGLGWLRGLHHLGVLERAKYLMVCSGASWLGAALSFQHVASPGEFLGRYLTPEDCTLAALAEVGEQGRSYAAAAANAAPLRKYLKEQLQGLVAAGAKGEEGAKEARAWSRAMAASFLAPFGLGDTDASTVTAEGTQGKVHERVAKLGPQAGRGTVYTADSSKLPFPVIVQAVMLPKDQLVYYPFEWTPLYGGCPVAYGSTQPKLGAGWVETLGLNAALVAKPDPLPGPDGGATHVRVRPMGPASLGEAIGISSAYNSYLLAPGETATKLLGFNNAQYFNQQDWSSSQVGMTDGCGTDYFAIYPALRRRVPNILVLSATVRRPVTDRRTRIADFPKFALFGCWPGNPKDTKGPSAAQVNARQQVFAPEGFKQLFDALQRQAEVGEPPVNVAEYELFGCWPGNPKDTKGPSAAQVNARQQVFAPEGFKQLFDALQRQAEVGEPPVNVAEYTVLANPALGIPGGWRVRVMWVVNDVQPAWEAALPQDTRAKLERDRGAKLIEVAEKITPLEATSFNEFPHITALAMNYAPELVGLMSNHAAHMLVRCHEAVESMLGGGAKGGRAEGGRAGADPDGVVVQVEAAGVVVHA
ncbi:hypothetical protein GPECTOR_13g854 [Gonium pectorale]|uniref:Uncharacterized protein n=1 Tax=Gonium pectorale TaxID=33097 RepID=A0A150GNL7_GONPE|nr:hypothetical protein GPECTOR_13g854 [Gonium pectorale]|eukprot:KXZ51365.1 hypothetical protein GPECTOR_13g854 [Gonium pectorale]